MVTSRSVPVEGVSIRWEEAGDGFPVVFVHGIPTSPALWRHVIPHVRGARCLALEMVGYGQSMPAGEGRDISVAKQADYLLSWLDEIGLRRAIFVGHDLGGGVAQIAAVRSPERCAGLLLTNAVCYDSWPIPAVRAIRRSAALVERIPPGMMPSALAPLMLRGHDDMAMAVEAWRVHVPPYARPGGPAALARQALALDENDTVAIQSDLHHLGLPARVVWGAADQFQKVRYGERLAADLDAPLERLSGGKHFTPEDHPGAIAAAVNDLVRTAQRSG